MGIIQRQAIRGTIYTYLGAAIGFITTIVVFPNYLETEEIGLLSILVAYALVFSQFSSFGFNSVATKMFPYFRNKEKDHNGFLFLALAVTITGFLLAIVAFFVLKNIYFENRNDTSVLLSKYYYYIIPLIFFILFFNTLDNYYKVLFKAVPGIFLRDVFQKTLTLLSAFIYAFNLINFHEFVLFYVASICLPTIVLSILIIKDRAFHLRPNFSFLKKDLVKTMLSVGAYGILASATGIVTLNIDRIMIENYLGLSLTGIYVTTFYFGQLIIMPARPLAKISSVFIANAWKENDIKSIHSIYKKSSINQFVVGLLLLIGISVNLDNIFVILNSKYEPGRYVIIVIGFAYLLEMIIGVVGGIIGNSKYYRYRAYFMFIQVVLIIITNIIFIPRYGILGAAIASLISKFFFSFIRVYFIYYKFRIHPFSSNTFMIAIIGIVTFLAGYLLPKFDNFMIDIVVRSSIVVIIYLTLILFSKVSDEITEKFNFFVRKIF